MINGKAVEMDKMNFLFLYREWIEKLYTVYDFLLDERFKKTKYYRLTQTQDSFSSKKEKEEMLLDTVVRSFADDNKILLMQKENNYTNMQVLKDNFYPLFKGVLNTKNKTTSVLYKNKEKKRLKLVDKVLELTEVTNKRDVAILQVAQDYKVTPTTLKRDVTLINDMGFKVFNSVNKPTRSDKIKYIELFYDLKDQNQKEKFKTINKTYPNAGLSFDVMHDIVLPRKDNREAQILLNQVLNK